jgi:glutathione S-transferase
MLKLYFSPSTSSLATHIALIECGADFKLVPRLISMQETRTAEYLAINPDGKVPALVTESGRVLTEVAATLYYLARKYPAAELWPEGDIEAEAEVISWMSFTASTLHGSRARAGARGQCLCRCEPQARRPAMGDRALLHRGHSSVSRLLAVQPGIDAARHLSALEAHHDRMLRGRPCGRWPSKAE